MLLCYCSTKEHLNYIELSFDYMVVVITLFWLSGDENTRQQIVVLCLPSFLFIVLLPSFYRGFSLEYMFSVIIIYCLTLKEMLVWILYIVFTQKIRGKTGVSRETSDIDTHRLNSIWMLRMKMHSKDYSHNNYELDRMKHEVDVIVMMIFLFMRILNWWWWAEWRSWKTWSLLAWIGIKGNWVLSLVFPSPSVGVSNTPSLELHIYWCYLCYWCYFCWKAFFTFPLDLSEH